MKDNIAFFTHYSDALENPKNQALIAEYGFEGYGKFWALNGFIGKASNCKLDISKKRNKAAIANKLQLSIKEFDEFIEFLSDDEECGLIRIEDGFIWNEQTQEDLDRAMASREAAANNRRKRKNDDGNQTVEQPLDNESEKLSNGSITNDNRKPSNFTDRTAQQSTGQEGQQQTAGELFDQIVDNSVEGPPVTAEEVHAAAAGINLQLGGKDAQSAAGKLDSYRLSADFVSWAVSEIRGRETIKSPPGFLKQLLLNLEQYQDWIDRYKSRQKRRTVRIPSPPGNTCPDCGGVVREIDGEVWCNSCRRIIWEYDKEQKIWVAVAGNQGAIAL